MRVSEGRTPHTVSPSLCTVPVGCRCHRRQPACTLTAHLLLRFLQRAPDRGGHAILTSNADLLHHAHFETASVPNMSKRQAEQARTAEPITEACLLWMRSAPRSGMGRLFTSVSTSYTTGLSPSAAARLGWSTSRSAAFRFFACNSSDASAVTACSVHESHAPTHLDELDDVVLDAKREVQPRRRGSRRLHPRLNTSCCTLGCIQPLLCLQHSGKAPRCVPPRKHPDRTRSKKQAPHTDVRPHATRDTRNAGDTREQRRHVCERSRLTSRAAKRSTSVAFTWVLLMSWAQLNETGVPWPPTCRASTDCRRDRTIDCRSVSPEGSVRSPKSEPARDWLGREVVWVGLVPVVLLWLRRRSY